MIAYVGYGLAMVLATIGIFPTHGCEVSKNKHVFFGEKSRINVVLRMGFFSGTKREEAALLTRVTRLQTPYSWWRLAHEHDPVRALALCKRTEIDRMRLLFAPSILLQCPVYQLTAKKSAAMRERKDLLAIVHEAIGTRAFRDAETQTDEDGQEAVLRNQVREGEAQLGDLLQELEKQEKISDEHATRCKQLTNELSALAGLREQLTDTLAIFQKDKTPAMKRDVITGTDIEMVAALGEQAAQIGHRILVAQFMGAIKVMGTSVFMLSRILSVCGKEVPENGARFLGVCKEFIGKLPEQKCEILAFKEQLNRCGEHAYDALADLAANSLDIFKKYATPQRRATGESDWLTQSAGINAFWRDFSSALGRVAPDVLAEITGTRR